MSGTDRGATGRLRGCCAWSCPQEAVGGAAAADQDDHLEVKHGGLFGGPLDAPGS
ncbi:MAG: hypothetical protein K2P04_06170 [Oscillospiraceae bacterium]|nr:hypothetical protein [Oscillospiraceae bacterium]